MGAIIRVDKINRFFKTGAETLHALKDIDMTIAEGRLTILRGRSGSGKTCMINLLGALDKPQSGSIVYYGKRDITKLAEFQRDALRRKDVGFVFQSVALIGIMSAYENVEFGLRVSGVQAAGRRQRAEEVLALVGLTPRMQHRPQELSGGEQQRVAIARAIAHNPRVLYADEPTAELDTHMGLQVMKVFKDLVKQSGLTVVMTTHDPSMIDLADDVYTLEDGRVIDYRNITPAAESEAVPG